MATPNSKKKRINDKSNDATAIAWAEPRNRPIQKARRVQVWLKNSVTTLTSPTAVEFDQNQRGSPRQRRRQRQRQSSPQRRPTSTTTSRKTTATIDQAMFSLYTYTGPKKKLQGTSMVPVEPETPSSYVPNYDYDWFLDGRADWKEENTTSCEYLKFLNDPWDMESYIGKYLQEREEKIQKEMQEEEEAFQFEAKFEEAAAESNHLDATIGDEEEEFGEFQEPSTSSVNETPGMGKDTEKQNHDDDDDFGDFQEATDVHQYIPSSSLDPQAELEIDNSLNTNPSEKETPQAPKEEISSDNNNNNDDDVNNDLVENKEETEHKAPIPELSQEKNNADDISSLGCYNSVDVDDDEGSDEEDDHHSTGKKSCPAALESTTEEQLPPMEISCNSNNTMPIMSPGSIGDSIFACSYQNEELESTEEELVAEAVQILATVRSTGDDDDDDEHEQMPFVEEACETTKQPQNEAENSSYSSTVDEAAGLSGEQDICTKTKTNISDEAGSSSSVPKDADIDKTTDADTTNKAAEAIPADCARGSNATVQVSSKLQTHTASEDASASSRKSSEDSIQTLGEDNLETTAETGEANDCTEEDEVDYFGDFYEAPLVHHESPIEQDHSDDDFGDFIDVPTDKIADDQLWVLQAGATTVDHTNTSDVEHRAEVFHSTADTGVAGFSEALSSFTPTFAVLPPLPGAPCSSDSNLSDSYTESQTSQQRAEQSQDIIFNAEQQNATAANVLDDYEIFSVGSNASTTSKCPISWRLTIEDLSTLEARFARRQWQKHNRQLKASHGSSVSFAESDYGSEFGQEQATPIDELEIPQYYFTQPDLDDTVRVLQNAPWHHIAHLWDDSQEDEDVSNLRIASSYSFEDQLDRRAVWEEYLTDELCHLDAAQNEVSKHLLKRIRPHEPTLKVANRSIHEFATNLHLAQMYLKRSQAAIRQAAKGTYDNERNLFQSNAGWHGAHDLLQAWDQQELYGRFQKTLDEIQDILDTEKLLLDRVENYAFSKENPREYEVLLRRVNKLKTLVLSHDAWRRLDALAYLRSRLTKNSLLSTFYNRLHILAGSMAVRCCRRRQNAVQEEYSTLLEAVMHVWDTLGNACELPGVEEEKKNLHLQLSATWPDTILQALCYEADRAMAASLLDPLIDTDNLEATVESEYEKELTQLAYELQQDWGDVAKLRTVTHNLVIIRFDWEDSNRYLLSVYHRLCLLLTDVLYAHYTFGLWHEQIVNKYESDCTGSEDSKEEKSETVDEQSTNKRSCSSKRLALLEKIRAKWLENREVIWKRCEAVLMKCLDEYVHFASHKSQKTTHQKRSSAVIDETISSNHSNASQNTEEDLWRNDLEDLHSILILTEQFMSMRDRLFGSTSVRCEYTKITGELKEKLCDVFRKNLRHIHVDAMKSLGMSLSQENWGLHSCKGLSGYEQTASMSIQEVCPLYGL